MVRGLFFARYFLLSSLLGRDELFCEEWSQFPKKPPADGTFLRKAARSSTSLNYINYHIQY